MPIILLGSQFDRLREGGYPMVAANNQIEKAEFAYARRYLPGQPGYEQFKDENKKISIVHQQAFLVQRPDGFLEVWVWHGTDPRSTSDPVAFRRRILMSEAGDRQDFSDRVLEMLWRDDFCNVSARERVAEVESYFAERSKRERESLEKASVIATEGVKRLEKDGPPRPSLSIPVSGLREDCKKRRGRPPVKKDERE